MLFNINNTFLAKLFINNFYNKQIFNNLDKIIKYHEITQNKNWTCEMSLKYKNDNILISNILLHNNKLNISYEELLYKDMNNILKLLDNDFHVLLKNKKQINIAKIPNRFYNNFNNNKKIINYKFLHFV
jgi:hypothetical protein